MFLKNAWYVAAWDTEVGTGQLLARRLLGTDVLLYRGENGKIVALQDRCCHRLAPLSHGQIEGNCVRCMYHGLVFDPSGSCVEIPGQDRISPKSRVRSFPVAEVDHLIWIWMGEPERADERNIPDTHWHDCEGWSAERGNYSRFRANFLLIADNLLDFSHLAFVHNKSIGSRKQGSVKPSVEYGEEIIYVRFMTPDSPPPPFAKQLSQLPSTVDRFNYYSWRIRSNYFAQDSVIAPVGEGYESQSDLTMKLHTFIALTPETENSTHYFWSTSHNHFTSFVEDLTIQLTRQVAQAFEEDRAVIELQQCTLEREPQAEMVAIAADATLLRARRMLDELVLTDARTAEDLVANGATR